MDNQPANDAFPFNWEVNFRFSSTSDTSGTALVPGVEVKNPTTSAAAPGVVSVEPAEVSGESHAPGC